MGRYRSVPDPLATVGEPRWLVIRDRASRPVRYLQLQSGTDLKATLAAERQRLIGEGWRADPLTRYSFVFCERDAERWCISIECFEPGHGPVGHGTHLGGRTPGK
jgi:hypothetical protein